MKTFRSKFIVFALLFGLVGPFAGVGSPAHAIDDSCDKSGMWTSSDAGLARDDQGAAWFQASVAVWACSRGIPGKMWIYSIENPKKIYGMTSTGDPYFKDYTSSAITQFVDVIKASKVPFGTYRVRFSGFKDAFGNNSGTQDITDSNGKIKEIIWAGNSTTTTDVPVPVPEVLDEDLRLVVHKVNFSATAYYQVTVRCSSACGSLPTSFSAKACEVNTGYMSPTCIASSRLNGMGSKSQRTANGSVNMFSGGFNFDKRPTGKTYQIYLSIPAGKNRKPVRGTKTFKWEKKALPSTSTIAAMAPVSSTIAPPTTTTVNEGSAGTTVPSTASSAALSVVSDLVSGATSLTVKGNGAAVTIDAAIKCSGQCTKLPASILGRLCKVGTSYSDASCTSIITLYPATGATPTSATFRGNTMFSTSPTGAVYQPFFSMVASGISTRTSLSGTSRVTWTK
jgi:hypothetical protein